MVGWVVVAPVVVLFGSWLAGIGVLLDNMYEKMPDGSTIGVICYAAGCLMWGWFMFQSDRDDLGFPRRRLPLFLLVPGPLHALVSIPVFLLMPRITVVAGQPDGLVANIEQDPIGSLVMAGLLWICLNVGVITGVPIFIAVRPLWWRLTCIVLWLAALIILVIRVTSVHSDPMAPDALLTTGVGIGLSTMLALASALYCRRMRLSPTGR